MIDDDILEAMKKECIALVSDTGKFVGSFVLHTNYRDTGEITYTFPLLMMYMMDGPGSHPFLGGATQMDWDFSLAVYAYEPDSYGSDASGYSESLSEPIALVRQHFTRPNQTWLTQEMVDVQERYNFRLTYGGTHKAPPLKYADGLALGYAIHFGSVAIDYETDSIEIVNVPAGELNIKQEGVPFT